MDQLDLDARAFLDQRGAPITASNLQSIKTFLQMNPDKRVELQASAPKSLLPATSDASAIPADALDAAVVKSMQPREGNQNVNQQRALKRKTGLSNNVQGLDMQGLATDPVQQPANSPQSSPGNISDAPAAISENTQSFVDPNNPPDPMAGVTNAPVVGDIGSVIEKILGTGAVGAAALAGRGRVPAVMSQAARAIPDAAQTALPAPRAALPAPGRAVGTDPNLNTIDMQGMGDKAVASGQANPIGHGRDTPLVQSPLKEAIKSRNKSKPKKKKDAQSR